MIEITSDAIERVGTLLADVPKGAERVFASAMNRGISRVKTQAIKQVKTVYAVNGAALTKATRINITKASTGNLAGFVSFSGAKIPLYKFKVTPTKPVRVTQRCVSTQVSQHRQQTAMTQACHSKTQRQ